MVWPLTIQDIIDLPENMEPTENNETGSQAAAANHNNTINPNEDMSTFDTITVNGENAETPFVDTPLIPDVLPVVGEIQSGSG